MSDPFHLIVPNHLARVEFSVMPLDLEAVADEAIQVLCEKLTEVQAAINYHKADTHRLLWLQDRLARSDYRISDDVLGNSDWTDIRAAIDAAAQNGL